MTAMVKNVVLFCLVLAIFFGCKKDEGIEIQDQNFPVDPEFEKVLMSLKIDNNLNGLIRYSEVHKIDSLNIASIYGLTSLKGIEHFENLRTLRISDLRLDSLDLSKNVKLQYLYCRTIGGEDYGRSLVYLNINNCSSLKFLDCGSNLLPTLNINDNKALVELYCGDNVYLKKLDISQNVNLKILDCGFTQLSELDVSKNLKLHRVLAAMDPIADLDLSMLPDLIAFDCRGTNISDLKIKSPEKLEELYLTDSKISRIDFNVFPNLRSLNFGSNLTSFDLRPLIGLKVMDVFRVDASELDLSGNVNLEHLVVRRSSFKTLDFTHNVNLKILFLFLLDNLQAVDVRPAIKLESFYSTFNYKLKTICVNKLPDPATFDWAKDDWTEFMVCK